MADALRTHKQIRVRAAVLFSIVQLCLGFYTKVYEDHPLHTALKSWMSYIGAFCKQTFVKLFGNNLTLLTYYLKLLKQRLHILLQKVQTIKVYRLLPHSLIFFEQKSITQVAPLGSIRCSNLKSLKASSLTWNFFLNKHWTLNLTIVYFHISSHSITQQASFVVQEYHQDYIFYDLCSYMELFLVGAHIQIHVSVAYGVFLDTTFHFSVITFDTVYGRSGIDQRLLGRPQKSSVVLVYKKLFLCRLLFQYLEFFCLVIQVKPKPLQSIRVFDGPVPYSHQVFPGKEQTFYPTSMHCTLIVEHDFSVSKYDLQIFHKLKERNMTFTPISLKAGVSVTQLFTSSEELGWFHAESHHIATENNSTVRVVIDEIMFQAFNSTDCRYGGLKFKETQKSHPHAVRMEEVREDLVSYCPTLTQAHNVHRDYYSRTPQFAIIILYCYTDLATLNVSYTLTSTTCKVWFVNPCRVGNFPSRISNRFVLPQEACYIMRVETDIIYTDGYRSFHTASCFSVLQSPTLRKLKLTSANFTMRGYFSGGHRQLDGEHFGCIVVPFPSSCRFHSAQRQILKLILSEFCSQGILVTAHSCCYRFW